MHVLLALLCLLTIASAADPVKANKLPGEAVAAMKNATKLILFSLEPPINVPMPDFTAEMTEAQRLKILERFSRETKFDPAKGHHGYTILGSTELSDATSRASAIAAITDAVRDFDGLIAKCFEPRHSLRVIGVNGTTYDFVACFECHQVYVFRGKKRIGPAGMTGSQKRLDDLLVAAEVQLAKPASSR